MKLLTAALLALGLAWSATPAQADPHYYVVEDSGPHSNGYVEIRSKAHGQGDVLCKVPASNYLNRRHEQNWSRWIWVAWEIPTPERITNPDGGTSYYGHSKDGRSAVEWNFVGADSKWCPSWKRGGWADKSDPDLRVLNGHPNDRFGVTRVINTWGPRVFSLGQWEDTVPVYRTQYEYFDARDRGVFGNPVCVLRLGQRMDWHRNVKNWGLTEIRIGNCLGYTDRSVFE